MNRLMIGVTIAAMLGALPACNRAAKKETPAMEMDMEKHEEEHPGEGEEHPGESSVTFSADQIKTAMRQHIEKATGPTGGLFLIKDPKENGRELRLRFVKIHDPVRVIKEKGYFACTDFQVEGEPSRLYDLDFWLNPAQDTLAVTETKIHKEPRMENGLWVKAARYTFVNDNPVEVP